MIKKTLVNAAIGVALFGSSVQATVYVDGVSLSNTPFRNNSGGEFKANPSAALQAAIYMAGYSSTVLTSQGGTTDDYVGGSFPTFCIESNEYFNWDIPYDVILNDQAVYGGNNPKFITKGTAYLYEQFAGGTLKDYDYANINTASDVYDLRKHSAAALQDAIWFLEGEGGANNAYVALAISAVGPTYNQPNFDGTTRAYPVRVMNIWDNGLTQPPTGKHQDQLVLVPEPTTYIAGGLLALPFLLGAWRARSAKRAMGA